MKCDYCNSNMTNRNYIKFKGRCYTCFMKQKTAHLNKTEDFNSLKNYDNYALDKTK